MGEHVDTIDAEELACLAGVLLLLSQRVRTLAKTCQTSSKEHPFNKSRYSQLMLLLTHKSIAKPVYATNALICHANSESHLMFSGVWLES